MANVTISKSHTGTIPKVYKFEGVTKPFNSIKIEKKISRQENFKRPLSAINATKNVQLRKNQKLSSTTTSTQKSEIQKENRELLNELSVLFSYPPILSPIRKSRMVINPCSIQFHRPRLIDDELKKMIDNFSKNIENLANGSPYEELIFGKSNTEEPEPILEESREKKRRSSEKLVPNQKRIKINRG